MAILAAKFLLAPAFVVAASLAARRWGAIAGGVFGGLPAVTAPILLIIAIQHGALFGSRAAAASLYGLVALAAYVLVYALLVRRTTWPWALAAGWAAFLLVDLALSPLPMDAWLGFALALASFVLTLLVMPRGQGEATDEIEFPNWSIPLRALAAAALVYGVTTAAAALGPHWSGLLTPFPVVGTVIAAFTHAHSGPEPTLEILRGFIIGLFAFATFCLLVSLLLLETTIAIAFTVAFAAALAIQIGVLLAFRR